MTISAARAFRNVGGRLVDALASIVAAAHVWRYRALSANGLATFQHASEAVSRVSLFFGYRVRERFYRRLLKQCGERLEINYGSTLSEPASRLGSDIWIGPFCYVDLCTIEDHVLIGPQVCILAGGAHHRMDRIDRPIRQQGNNSLRRIRIGEGAWIGAGATVLADVGKGAVVGAGAVVTKRVPDFGVAVGNPARVIRYRDQPSARGDDERAFSMEILGSDGDSDSDRPLPHEGSRA